jgi:hypothetical protein
LAHLLYLLLLDVLEYVAGSVFRASIATVSVKDAEKCEMIVGIAVGLLNEVRCAVGAGEKISSECSGYRGFVYLEVR